MTEPTITPLIIAGVPVIGAGAELSVVNPSNGEQIGRVCAASAEQIDDAVAAGAREQANGAWAKALPHERASVLVEVARVIESRVGLLADLQMRENGKTHKESVAQAQAAASYFRYYASVCEVIEDAMPPARGDYICMQVHEPVGVVAALTPWNSPLTMGAQKLAPAFAAGNAVVLKAAETTSLVTLALGQCCLDGGVPAPLLSVITGGAQIGRALVEHPAIGLVSFTGGTSTGQSIARGAAQRLVPLILELGGKSPHIVFADADLDAAAKAVAAGIFGGTGQSCVAGSRLFIERSVQAPFLERLIVATEAMTVGPPADEASVIGPLSSFSHRQTVERFVAQGLADGGKILHGGARPASAAYESGAYYLPTIIGGLSSRSSTAQDEIFGPVLCVLPFDSQADLIEQANDSVFGLAAGIWSKDYPRAWAVARALQAGTIWINTYKQLSIAAAFGGFKLSGLGREKGLQGLRAYQQPKSVYWGL